MVQKSRKKPYALMAGVCYGICGLDWIIEGITDFQNINIAINVSYIALNVISWIALIGMAVALFLKKEKVVIVFAGVNALRDLYYLVDYLLIVINGNIGNNLLIAFRFISYALVVVLILLTLTKIKVVQKIWFTAGVARLLGYLINLIYYYYNYYYIDFLIECDIDLLLEYGHFAGVYGFLSYISSVWMSILYILIEFAGLMLIGLWLKEHDFSLSKVEHPNEYSKSDSQTVYSSSLSDTAIGGADKLKIYNELLEDGTITQEEFDAKKKQILGL